MAPRLRLYRDQPFNESTEINLDDFYLDLNGTDSTFTLANKTNLQMGATVQANLVEYYLYNGGFTKVSTDQFTTNVPPAIGSNLVAPGINPLILSAFDQLNVDGVSASNVYQNYFYLGDNVDIATTEYQGLNSKNQMISLIFRDQIGYGATTAMVQLACATQDAPGTPMTFIATGAEMLTPGFTAFTTVAASSVAGDTLITVNSSADASEFIIGDYITINVGNPTYEVTKLLAVGGVSGNQLTVTQTTYNHYIGESIYDTHRKFWAQLTVPVNFTDNSPQNYYNISLYCQATFISRV